MGTAIICIGILAILTVFALAAIVALKIGLAGW
jgi:hypothetical protein